VLGAPTLSISIMRTIENQEGSKWTDTQCRTFRQLSEIRNRDRTRRIEHLADNAKLIIALTTELKKENDTREDILEPEEPAPAGYVEPKTKSSKNFADEL
jgi:hypothetical protein